MLYVLYIVCAAEKAQFDTTQNCEISLSVLLEGG
jgi:hypothetical protein